MGAVKLPKQFIPKNASYRKFTPGVDLPAWFYYNIKALDPKLYFVYHPYRILWDDVINNYYGSLTDPRHTIHIEEGELNFGFVLTDNIGAPIPDCRWGLWRLADPYGWTHVVDIDSKDPDYLTLLADRLLLQVTIKAKGKKAWRDKQIQDEEDKKEKDFKDKEQRFNDVRDENSWLTRKAMENFDRGIYKPTNPTRDIITSYAGQGNRSRIVRPITDKEGGLI